MYVALNLDEAVEYYSDESSCTVRCIRGDETRITECFADAEKFFTRAWTDIVFNLYEALGSFRNNPDVPVMCRDGIREKSVCSYKDAIEFFNAADTETSVKGDQSAFRIKAVTLVRRLADALAYGIEYSGSDKNAVSDFLGTESIPENTDYSALKKILKRAFNQAADGKGKERHADGRKFEEQPIIRIQELVGSGFCLGQAIKKIQESIRLETPQASMELLGAVNYIAAVIFFRERQYTKED